ncbi:uncharacterized protein LOC128263812 isoform X2 [Drosophila gunungcola]|uniref:uncharacterized protein LOC128263812 isoform X2 n=1 Tax=Drosophila gunungcola TaxID=103775 RepID=UPI0022E8D70B|nr:uncharacterized protein LOC128263812 isoform X2 [Drosophila gunungcola]
MKGCAENVVGRAARSSSSDVVKTAARMEKSLAAKTSASPHGANWSGGLRSVRVRGAGGSASVDLEMTTWPARAFVPGTDSPRESGRLGDSRCSCWRWRLLLLRLMLLRLMLLRLMLLRLMLLRLMLLRLMLLRPMLLRLMLRLMDDDQVRSACKNGIADIERVQKN